MPWKHYFQGKYKIVNILLTILLLAFFVLLSARMFILLFLLFIIPYFLKKSFKNTKRCIIVSMLTIIFLYWGYNYILTSNNPIRNRYQDMINRNTEIAWLTDYSNVEESSFDNIT